MKKTERRKLGKSSRRRGHNLEREYVQIFNQLGLKAKSSRSESKSMDDSGVDIMIENFPISLKPQCKISINNPDFLELLNTNANIVIFRKSKKSGTKFMNIGDIIVMKPELFIAFIELIKPLLYPLK